MSKNEVKQNEGSEEGSNPEQTPSLGEVNTGVGTQEETQVVDKDKNPEKEDSTPAPAKKSRFAEALASIEEADKQEIFAFLMSAQQQKLSVDTTLYLFAEKIQYALDKLK